MADGKQRQIGLLIRPQERKWLLSSDLQLSHFTKTANSNVYTLIFYAKFFYGSFVFG